MILDCKTNRPVTCRTALWCAVLQTDVDLPAGAADRVHIYFTEGSCMAITPVAVPETVTVQGDTVTPNTTKQHTKVRSTLAAPRQASLTWHAFRATWENSGCSHGAGSTVSRRPSSKQRRVGRLARCSSAAASASPGGFGTEYPARCCLCRSLSCPTLTPSWRMCRRQSSASSSRWEQGRDGRRSGGSRMTETRGLHQGALSHWQRAPWEGAHLASAALAGDASLCSTGAGLEGVLLTSDAVCCVRTALCAAVVQVFAPFMYKTVLHVLHTSFDDPSAPLPQRLAQHHELYDELKERCQDFLDGHPQ